MGRHSSILLGFLARDSEWVRGVGTRKREERKIVKVVLHRIVEMHAESMPILQIKRLKNPVSFLQQVA